MCECKIDRRALGKLLAGAAGASALPGAAQAATVTALAVTCIDYRLADDAFWDQIGIAKQLHHIKKVIVVDHRDCGAYKVAYGKDYQGQGAAETAQHKSVMEQVKAKLAKTHPDLGCEFYLMALDGTAERVV